MAFIINKQRLQPDEVEYHGKVLPRDKGAPFLAPQDQDVNYAGRNLPTDKSFVVPPAKDLTNNPSLIIIGGVTLPADTLILMDFEKLLPGSKIIDGVYVVEHVGRKPYEIEFEGTFRVTNAEGTKNIFPQDEIDNLFQNVWLPDSVQKLQNTYLNRLGIQEIIIKGGRAATVRGSTNLPFKLKVIENIPGTTLIVGG